MRKYRPCKMLFTYKYLDNYVYIIHNNKLMRLDKYGLVVFKYSDGKHTIDEIVSKCSQELQVEHNDKLYQQVCDFIKKMYEKELILPNWDPIKKYEMPQM